MFVPELMTFAQNLQREKFSRRACRNHCEDVATPPALICHCQRSPGTGPVHRHIAGFLISDSVFTVQIGGPPGAAFVVIVTQFGSQHGVDGLLIATRMGV